MRKLVVALCACLMISISGCAASRIQQAPVAENSKDTGKQVVEAAASEDDSDEAMELLKQYGNKSEAKRAFMKDLRQECPGFTPSSGLAKHAECLKKYREFILELNKM